MRITRGHLLAQRFFDIADEIDLVEADALLRDRSRDLSRRPRFVGSAKQIRIPDPPLEMVLDPRPCGLSGVPDAAVTVRLYALGTVAVTFVIDLPSPTAPDDLIALGARILDAEEAITEAARPVMEEVARTVASACKPGSIADFTEDYTVFVLQEVEPALDAAELIHQLDIAALLLGETVPLAPSETEHLLRTTFSYYPDDLVVVDWNSALVVDPRTAHQIAYLLELSSVQLLNLRAYDHVVGTFLDGLYDELEVRVGSRRLFAASSYEKLSRRIMRLFVDITEMAERSETSLQYLGETWLARIHRGAMTEFDIPGWQSRLKNKLDVLQQVNKHLGDQINNSRSLGVELAIVFLILIEILLALFEVV